MGPVLGVTDLAERGPGGGLGRLGQGVHDVGHLVHPAPLVRRVGEDLAEGAPEPECAVADGEHRGAHAPALQATQHVGPRLGRLAVPVGDRDQLFGPISAHAHDDQGTQAGLFEADVEVDAVGEHVDVVDVFEGPMGELVALALPVASSSRVITEAESPAAEPKNSSSAGTKSPELIPCRYISGSTSATLGDLRAHGGRIELRKRIVPPVSSSTRRSSTRGARTSMRSGPGHQRAWLGVSVAHDQAMAVLVDLMDQARDVALDLGLEGGGQHPPRPFGHQLVEPARQLRARGLVNMYSQHRRSFLPASHRQRTCLCQTGRYAAPPFRWCIHRFRL